MLEVVTFKWAKPGYRSTYGPEHVNTMYNMVRRHYAEPFRFTCVTDNPKGIDDRVRCVELWDDFKDMPSPHGEANPSCFRRLKLYSDWARTSFGPRILQIDLDMVLVDDVRSLWNRPEREGVLWADNLNPTSPYNGAMQLITPGLHPVWECFKADPQSAITRARASRFFGSDQAQLALWLGPNMPRWTAADGAVSWRVHCRQTPPGQAHMRWSPDCKSDLPSGAKVVNFHGLDDPDSLVGRVDWITENYR